MGGSSAGKSSVALIVRFEARHCPFTLGVLNGGRGARNNPLNNTHWEKIPKPKAKTHPNLMLYKHWAPKQLIFVRNLSSKNHL